MMKEEEGSFEGLMFQPGDVITSSVYRELSAREESVRSLTLNGGNSQKKQEAVAYLNRYLPFSSEVDLSQLKLSPFLRVKKYKESIFYGEIQNSKKQGLGIMVYFDKKVYEGEWKADKKHGKGAQKFNNNGSVYIGCFQGGKPHGRGRYVWPSGQEYEGQWRMGQRHGSGIWIGPQGDSYEGDWKLGKPQGFGTYTSINQDVYQGEFKDSLRNGQGVQKFSNGDMYRGCYANGKASGSGNYYWANGSYFKGNFLNGLREGKGLWKKGVGSTDKYDGTYRNDKKWGYGEFTWASGNVYKGNYEADQRYGYGQMYWTNGACYKGQWSSGVQNGLGEAIIPGQGYKKGLFQNNVIIRIDQQEVVTNSFRQAHQPAAARVTTRSITKISQNESIISDGKSSFKRRTLVNSRPLINSQDDRGKRNYFSQRKPIQNTLRHTIDQKKGLQEGNRVRQREHSYSFNKSVKTKPFKKIESSGKSFVRSSRKDQSNQSQQRLLHSSFYLYKLGFRKNIESRRYQRRQLATVDLPQQNQSSHVTFF